MRGKPTGKLVNAGPVQNRRGTTIRFKPDPQIFGTLLSARRGCTGCAAPRPTCSAACRSAGPAIPALLKAPRRHPGRGRAAFPRRPARQPGRGYRRLPRASCRKSGLARPIFPRRTARTGRLEWAAAWLEDGDGFLHSYCNTVPTPQGGTHEAGFRAALLKGLRAWGEHRGNRRAAPITAEDLLGAAGSETIGVPARPAVPGPDQGKADQRGSRAAGGNRAARPLRPLARRRSGAGRQPARLRHRARRGTPAPQGQQGHRPQIRDPPAAPARQADRLHARERGRDRDFPGRGRFAPAARPSRRATAKPRRCCRCAAKS